jgi:predicted ATPase
MIQHGWALAMQGDVAQGIVEFQQGLTSWKALAAVLHLSYFPLLLAEVYLKARQPEAGLAAVEEALAAATAYDDHYWEAEIHRLRGELLLMVGKTADEAEAAFQQALQVARRQQAKSLELRVAVSLSRLWQKQCKIGGAQELLSTIYNWFTEGFDTVDLREAKALLDELNSICRG